MPVIIEELTTTLEIRDEVKIRKLVREEIAHAMRDEQRKRAVGRERVDPTDPAASGRPGQGGGLPMASGAGVAKVTLEILDAVEIAGFAQRKLQVPFNPTEFSADRDATYAEVAIPGLDAPVLQYVRGGGEKLNLELFFDVTDLMVGGVVADGSSVRDRYVQPLQRLTLVDRVLHAPPRVRVAWDAQVLIERAVVTSVSVTYTLFDTQGRPVRATARVAFRQHTSASAQLAEIGLTSPDLTNVATVRQGDTLPAIAFREYGDPTRWRSIAEANAITNPLDLAPGRVLVVPKIV